MIEIENLNLNFKNRPILSNLDFALAQNECVAITGNSGCGKSMFAKVTIRLFDDDFSLSADKFKICGRDILAINQDELREHRRNVCALIFQNSHSSFHPMLNVGDHFNLYLKKTMEIGPIKKTAFEYFAKFGFDDANTLWHKFSYELSGGEASRVQIVLALCLKPKILICDEITSSLDALNKRNIINMLNSLKREIGIIFITHELGLISHLRSRILNLKNGKFQ